MVTRSWVRELSVVGQWSCLHGVRMMGPRCPHVVSCVSMGGLQCLYDLSLMGHGFSGVGTVDPSSGESMVGPRRVHGAPGVDLWRLHGGSEVDR